MNQNLIHKLDSTLPPSPGAYSQSIWNRRLPSIPLAGVWLKNAGFEVGDFAHIVVMDGVLVVRCERLLDNENREK